MPNWTNKEEKILKEHYKEVGIKKASEMLSRHSESAIYRKASRMQITQDYQLWGLDEQRFLSINCRDLSIKEIAVRLNRTERSVREELSKLKLYSYQVKNSKNKCVDCGKKPGDKGWSGWWTPGDQHWRSNLCQDCAKEYF